MQAFTNIEMNFDFLLITSDSLVSLTFVLLANIVILSYCDRALPINLNLVNKLALSKHFVNQQVGNLSEQAPVSPQNPWGELRWYITKTANFLFL